MFVQVFHCTSLECLLETLRLLVAWLLAEDAGKTKKKPLVKDTDGGGKSLVC